MRRKPINPIEFGRTEKSKIVACMNNKGGCGKTTSAVAFGLHMARLGKSVLFVDADQQSNMSQRLGLNDNTLLDERISNLFRMSDMENAEREHLDLPLIVKYKHFYRAKGSETKPGMVALLAGSHNAEIEAVAASARLKNTRISRFVDLNEFFRKTMQEYKRYFDYIIIDTAPAMEGNVLNKIVVSAADEIICPIDGLEAALGLRAFISWVYGETEGNEQMPNINLAMVKYQTNTKAMGDISAVNLRNSVYRSLKNVFGDFVCDNGVKEQGMIKNSVQGFKKTDFMDLSNELNEKFSDNDHKNIFDTLRPESLEELSESLSEIEKKIITKKPEFRNISLK